jgi:hypothetical protein
MNNPFANRIGEAQAAIQKPRSGMSVADAAAELRRRQEMALGRPSSPWIPKMQEPSGVPGGDWMDRAQVGAVPTSHGTPSLPQKEFEATMGQVIPGSALNKSDYDQIAQAQPAAVKPVQAIKDVGTGAAANYGLDSLLPASSVSSAAPVSAGYPATEAMMSGAAAPQSMTPLTSSFGAAEPVVGWTGGLGSAGLLGAAGVAAGAGTGAAQLGGLKNVAENDKMSVAQQAALALPTFGTSLLYNPVREMFDSGKDPEQHARDAIRKELKNSNFLDEGYNITNADDSKFDIGRDGGDPQYNVDFSRDGIGETVALVDPLAAILANGDTKLRNDFAGYMANAAGSSGDPIENAKKYFADLGYDHAKAYDAVGKLDIDPAERDAFFNSLDKLFGANAYSNGSSSGSSSGSSKKKGKGSSKDEAPPVLPPAAPNNPVTPPPSQPDFSTPEKSEQDYIEAIKAVNSANTTEETRASLRKKKNPLGRKL